MYGCTRMNSAGVPCGWKPNHKSHGTISGLICYGVSYSNKASSIDINQTEAALDFVEG